MDTLKFLADNFAVLASLIASLSAIGSFLIWFLKKTYLEPRDRRREKESRDQQLRMEKVVEERNKPLQETLERINQTIQNMNQTFQDFQDSSSRDRENLNKIADQNIITLGEHEDRLDDHNERLIVLEYANEIPRKVNYKEVYKGDEE